MRYENNWALGGKKCIFYKLETQKHIPSISSNVNEIGIEYRKETETVLQKITLGQDFTLYRFENFENDNCLAKVRQTPNYPLIVMLKNLTPNTSYIVRGYIIIDGETYIVNECQVNTLQEIEGNSVECTEYRRQDSCKESDYDSHLPSLKKWMNVAIGMMNEVTNVNFKFDASIYDLNDGTGAGNDMSFNLHTVRRGTMALTSIIIHEIGHNYFDFYAFKDFNMQFMEFATDCEGAICQMLSTHFYPFISSYYDFDYIDNALICLAMEISRQNKNR